MPGVQGPAVVCCYELPPLHGQPRFDGVLLDVADRPPKIVRVVLKDDPAGPAPDGVTFGAVSRFQQPLARIPLQRPDHLLREVAVLADQHVDVVGHDRAGVAGVSPPLDGGGERIADDRNLFGREGQQVMLQDRRGAIVELADLPSRGLGALASVVEFSELGDHVGRDAVRHAPPRIVGQPPPVCGPDEVVTKDHSRPPFPRIPLAVSHSP